MSILEKRLARLAGLLLLIVLTTSCGEGKLIPPRKPVIGDDIVFSSTRDGGSMDLFTVNTDGSGLHRLTNDTLEDYQPRWSPDGTKIVFAHRYARGGDSTAVSNATVMNADGTTRRRLAYGYDVFNPSWSPDGSRISYQVYSGNGRPNELRVVNADGTDDHLLISSDSLDAVQAVTWTSQNTFLGYDWAGLVQFNADGTGKTRLATLSWVKDANPRMSPDGSMIAFEWGGPSDTALLDIWTVKADGSDLKRLTNVGTARYPIWSPDGSKIAYVNGDRWWSMNIDGTYQVPMLVLNSFGQDLSGDWK